MEGHYEIKRIQRFYSLDHDFPIHIYVKVAPFEREFNFK
jgi:hypothetical protein